LRKNLIKNLIQSGKVVDQNVHWWSIQARFFDKNVARYC